MHGQKERMNALSNSGYDFESNLFSYWGKAKKTKEHGGAFEWHPVLYHSLDCASVAKAWLDTSPGIKRALNADENLSFILFFIYMHDFGKISARFSTIVFPLWEILFQGAYGDIVNVESEPYQHGPEGSALFSEEFLEEEECDWMCAAGKHHDRCRDSRLYSQKAAKEGSALFNDEAEARKEFVKIGRELFFNGKDESFLDMPSVPGEFLGFCSVCDWIASNPDFFPFVTEKMHPLDYFNMRYSLAKQALSKCGLISEKPSCCGMELFDGYTPRGIQKLDVPAESGLLFIVEAPTGSGKTEAALSIASRLIVEGVADSIIFALPTQATANSMFSRLEEVARKMYPQGSNIVLAHGKSRFNEGFRSLCAQGDGNIENEGLLQCSIWIATSKKRAFLGQIGVCTVDQVLLGALPIRHNFVRTFAVGRSVLIIDEVHAYDSYMNGLLDDILKKQAKCNGVAILLSATLPSCRKEEIIKRWSKKKDVSNLSLEYPLVTVVNGTCRLELVPDDKPEPKTIRIESRRFAGMLPDDELIDRVAGYAKEGFAVAVICNLVSDAQVVWKKIKDQYPDVQADLFHSRYAFSDRSSIENMVIERYGKNRKGGAGSVLVATQVIEQSLDLDFDFMVTQICPIELLFQRLGRLYRHVRQKRPHDEALCVVISPKNDDFKPHDLIYRNLAHLWRARALIEKEPEAVFPDVYRRWIELAHTGFNDEPKQITDADSRCKIDESGRSCAAENLTLMNHADLNDCRAELLTRDGDMNINILPVDECGCLLDENGTELKKLHSATKDLGANETVQLQSIPCPSSWKKYIFDERDKAYGCAKDIDGYTVITVDTSGDSWTFKNPSKKVNLFYSKEEGLRKE